MMGGKSRKVKVLWIGGKASTGKSLFICRLREIFGSEEVSWRDNYLPPIKKFRPELVTQLVTCEEFCFQSAFGPTQIETTKLMFEGQGCSFRKGPYKPFETRYTGAVCVIASNTMPHD